MISSTCCGFTTVLWVLPWLVSPRQTVWEEFNTLAHEVGHALDYIHRPTYAPNDKHWLMHFHGCSGIGPGVQRYRFEGHAALGAVRRLFRGHAWTHRAKKFPLAADGGSTRGDPLQHECTGGGGLVPQHDFSGMASGGSGWEQHFILKRSKRSALGISSGPWPKGLEFTLADPAPQGNCLIARNHAVNPIAARFQRHHLAACG